MDFGDAGVQVRVPLMFLLHPAKFIPGMCRKTPLFTIRPVKRFVQASCCWWGFLTQEYIDLNINALVWRQFFSTGFVDSMHHLAYDISYYYSTSSFMFGQDGAGTGGQRYEGGGGEVTKRTEAKPKVTPAIYTPGPRQYWVNEIALVQGSNSSGSRGSSNSSSAGSSHQGNRYVAPFCPSWSAYHAEQDGGLLV